MHAPPYTCMLLHGLPPHTPLIWVTCPLAGQAVSNVFDGDKNLDELVMKGINRR